MLPWAIRAPDRLGRHVDQLELVGTPDDVVGHGLALRRAGDPQDDVVERLEVLDVQRRDHVDAGVEQLLDVLPTLLVLRPGGVGVGIFVDQHHLRVPRQDRVEVHLAQRRAAVVDLLQRHDFEVADLAGRLLLGRGSRRGR